MNNESTAVTLSPRMPITTMRDAALLATAFAQAHVMGAQNDAEGMLAVTLIHEIGLVKAEASYHIMMGRLTKKAEAILADFIRAGGKYKIVQRDAMGAKIVASMGETKDATFAFMWEDALQEPFVYAGTTKEQRAALKKPVEDRIFKDKYATPRSRMQMMWARLVSDMGRALCPAATDGMYPPEEVADFDENNTSSGKIVDVQEVNLRVQAQSGGSIDYTVCPIIINDRHDTPWAELDNDTLQAALVSEIPIITVTHKAAIRLVLEGRKETK